MAYVVHSALWIGSGSGDDETITINLNHWNNDDESNDPVLCAMINIYSGADNFKGISNCTARVLDDNDQELCRFNLTEEYDTRAVIMCHIERRESGLWSVSADGVGCSGSTAHDSLPEVMAMLKAKHANNGHGVDQEMKEQEIGVYGDGVDGRIDEAIIDNFEATGELPDPPSAGKDSGNALNIGIKSLLKKLAPNLRYCLRRVTCCKM